MIILLNNIVYFERINGITTIKTEEDKHKFEMNLMLCWEKVKSDNPELFKKEDAAIKADPKNDGASLEDIIEIAKNIEAMKAEQN